MNKYKITMQSGVKYTTKHELDIDELSNELFNAEKLYLGVPCSLVLLTKYIESIEVINE